MNEKLLPLYALKILSKIVKKKPIKIQLVDCFMLNNQ